MSFLCERLMDFIGNGELGSDGVNETHIAYTTVVFSNLDVDVTCQAAIGAKAGAASGGYFPAKSEVGKDGVCYADADYPPYGQSVGRWRFSAARGGPVAEMEEDDPGHPMNGIVVQFEENDCQVYVAQDDGAWKDAALSDVF